MILSLVQIPIQTYQQFLVRVYAYLGELLNLNALWDRQATLRHLYTRVAYHVFTVGRFIMLAYCRK